MNPATNTEQKIQSSFTDAGELTADLQVEGVCVRARSKYRQFLGWFGLGLALPFFIWVLLWWSGVAPSMIDVFGVTGIRIPASVTIAGLLFAAVGFYEV